MIEIDGINIIERYECYVELGGIEDFLSTAPIKQPKEVDWFERDGVEVDLEDVRLQARDLKMNIITKNEAGADRLILYLKSKQVSVFKHHTGIERECLFLGVSNRTDEDGITELTLAFRELAPEKPSATAKAIKPIKGELDLDGTPLSKHGIYVIDSDKYQPIEIKKGVSVTPLNKNGEVYYKPSKAHIKKRQRVLGLFTKGDNAISNYQALLAQILKDGEHTIDGKRCYYNEARVTEFDETEPGEKWLSFDLKLTIYD